MLFSTESLNNLTKSQVDLLEDCDKKFMRRLFESEQGTPIEAFYIEIRHGPSASLFWGAD